MKASRIDYLIDAGPLVGAFWPADQWHHWSRQTLGSVRREVFTTESVFAEAAYHLKTHPPALFQLLAALESGLVEFLPIHQSDSRRAAEIIHAYPRQGDWSDASLLILSERHPKARLITTDRRDFTIYRRRDGNPVPCILPPTD